MNQDKSLLSSARVKSSPTKDSIDDSGQKLHRTNSEGIFVLSSEKQPSQASSSTNPIADGNFELVDANNNGRSSLVPEFTLQELKFSG